MTDAPRTQAGTRVRRGLVGVLAAVFVSQLGTRMSFLAVPWLVLSTTGSPVLAGVVGFAEMSPYVIVQALGGPLVDRIGARRTSVTCDAVAGVSMGAIPLIHALGELPVAALAVLVAVTGAIRGAGDTARDVLIPGAGALASMPIERSAGLYDGVSRLASLLGAPLAGVLITQTSAITVLGLDAGTFFASALILALTVHSRDEPPKASSVERVSYLVSLREGYRYLRGDRLLLGIAAMVLVTNTLDQAQATVFTPVWAREVAHSPIALGLIGGAFSLGAVLGNATLTCLAPHLPRRIVYGAGFLLTGAPRYLVMAAAATLTPVLPIVLIAGFGAGGINPVLGAVQYERVPRHLQARVLGAVNATAWAGMPIGSLGGGLLVDAVGIRMAFAIAGTTYLVVTSAPFVFPAWRDMDRPAEGTS